MKRVRLQQSEKAEGLLEDNLESVDWNKFKTTLPSKKCVDDGIATKTSRVYPNPEPWMNGKFHGLLKCRLKAFTKDEGHI